MAAGETYGETARSPLTQPELRPRWPQILLDRGEVFFALLFTGIIVCVHGVRMADAGGLWRDEAGAVQLATMPSFKDVVSNFPHEAFPLLFPATVRAYAALSGGGDAAWRFFGFLVGIGVIGALWWNLWVLRRGVPLLSLALLGFNAAFVQWGDSVRGYGLGTLLMLMTVGLVWRVLEKPSARRVAAAALCAVASVQCLFQNSPLLLAICVGGAAVALARGNKRTAVLVLGVGLCAAVSLVPYWGALQRAREWDVVIRGGASVAGLSAELTDALSSSGWWMAQVWAGLSLFGLGMAIYVWLRPSKALLEGLQGSVLLFAGLALVVGVIGYFAFLLALSYPTKAWYYLALMGLVALLLDVAIDSLRKQRWARILRLTLAIVLAASSLRPTWRLAGVRQTNADFIAARLARLADEGDLIVVTPWYHGISFWRYYGGAAKWVTIPPITFPKFHRYDLIKGQMMLRDQTQPVRPVLAAAQAALKQGHRVWLVSDVEFLPPGASVPLPPPAPSATWGWHDDLYAHCWSVMATAYLRAGAREAEKVPVAEGGQVSRFEDLKLWMFVGWAPSAP
jgi:hypothetical protein